MISGVEREVPMEEIEEVRSDPDGNLTAYTRNNRYYFSRDDNQIFVSAAYDVQGRNMNYGNFKEA